MAISYLLNRASWRQQPKSGTGCDDSPPATVLNLRRVFTLDNGKLVAEKREVGNVVCTLLPMAVWCYLETQE